MKKLTEKELEELQKEFAEMTNRLSKLPFFKQMTAYMVEFPEFYNKIFTLGYNSGRADGIVEGQSNFTKLMSQ